MKQWDVSGGVALGNKFSIPEGVERIHLAGSFANIGET